MSFKQVDFATEPAVVRPEHAITQADFASMVSGEEPTLAPASAPKSNQTEPTPAGAGTAEAPNPAPAAAVVTPVAEKPLEKPLHYDLKLPQPVIYKPLLFSKKVKRGSKKSKK